MSGNGQNSYPIGTPEIVQAADFQERTDSKKKKRPKTGKIRSTVVEEEKHAYSEFTPVPNFESESAKSKRLRLISIFM